MQNNSCLGALSFRMQLHTISTICEYYANKTFAVLLPTPFHNIHRDTLVHNHTRTVAILSALVIKLWVSVKTIAQMLCNSSLSHCYASICYLLRHSCTLHIFPTFRSVFGVSITFVKLCFWCWCKIPWASSNKFSVSFISIPTYSFQFTSSYCSTNVLCYSYSFIVFHVTNVCRPPNVISLGHNSFAFPL